MIYGNNNDKVLTARMEGAETSSHETRYIPLVVSEEEINDWEKIVDDVIQELEALNSGYEVAEILDADGKWLY